MSALPPKADIGTQSWNVRFVPKADIRFDRSQRVNSTRTHLNAPYFEAAADATFKGVEVAHVALRLNSEQTHFYVAFRAEKQRHDFFFLGRPWDRTNVPHAMRLCWLVALLTERGDVLMVYCGSDLNSLIAARCNAVEFLSPRCANSMIFSATNLVMASSRLLNPSASHVITNAFATACA